MPETREVMAAEFTTTGNTFQRERIRPLFTIPTGVTLRTDGAGRTYDVALDDERFLMARAYGSDDSSTSAILVLNFFEELKARVPN